jgi:DNA processing protein
MFHVKHHQTERQKMLNLIVQNVTQVAWRNQESPYVSEREAESWKAESLWIRGNIEAVNRMDEAIVVTGARASTGYGEHVTMEIVTRLTENGYQIINGGAYGIDGMALRASLAAGGQPIVWLAGGVDRLYPSGHNALLARVLENGGAIISAEPDGHSPTKERTLARNAFMAKTSRATLVVEAGWRSGSLDVAYAAYNHGNIVMAVPGPVTSPTSEGTNELLRSGFASLVCDANQIIEKIVNN